MHIDLCCVAGCPRPVQAAGVHRQGQANCDHINLLTNRAANVKRHNSSSSGCWRLPHFACALAAPPSAGSVWCVGCICRHACCPLALDTARAHVAWYRGCVVWLLALLRQQLQQQQQLCIEHESSADHRSHCHQHWLVAVDCHTVG